MDLVVLAVRQRLAWIDAGDLRADDRRQLVDRDGLVRRAILGGVPIARPLVAAQGSLYGFLLLQLVILARWMILPQHSFSDAVKAANSAGLPVVIKMPPETARQAGTTIGSGHRRRSDGGLFPRSATRRRLRTIRRQAGGCRTSAHCAWPRLAGLRAGVRGSA